MTTDKPSPLVPRLRFPEFAQDPGWDHATITDLVETVTPPKKLTTSTYLADGRFPIIDQSQSYTCGWTNDDEAVITRPLPVIIFGDHTCVLKLVNRPFAQGADGVKVLTARIRVSTLYLYHQLTCRPVVTEEYKRHFSALKEKVICFPDEKSGEQRKIADCLGSLDDLIAAEGRKLEALRQHKQGLMQQIFPQPGETAPRLRFPGFRDAADWKTKILGTQGRFLSSLTGKTAKDFDTGDAAFIPYMNVFSNAFTTTTDLRSVIVADDESQSAVAKGDVFFTVSSETPEEAGMSSVLLEEIENCYLNSFCALFRFDEGKSPDTAFLGYLLRSAPAREHLSRGAQGATRYNISRPTFRSLPILIPSGAEQKKIANYLGSLDDLIAAEGRKTEALRQHKKGLMQQVFPSLERH